jgi:hypothetical protein
MDATDATTATTATDVIPSVQSIMESKSCDTEYINKEAFWSNLLVSDYLSLTHTQIIQTYNEISEIYSQNIKCCNELYTMCYSLYREKTFTILEMGIINALIHKYKAMMGEFTKMFDLMENKNLINSLVFTIEAYNILCETLLSNINHMKKALEQKNFYLVFY